MSSIDLEALQLASLAAFFLPIPFRTHAHALESLAINLYLWSLCQIDNSELKLSDSVRSFRELEESDFTFGRSCKPCKILPEAGF